MGHNRKTCLTIFVNDTCNLQCIYCYVGDHPTMIKKTTDIEDLGAKNNLSLSNNSHIIDINFVKRGIFDFFNQYKSRHIRFFSSGEATVAFDRMKEIREWVSTITEDKCIFELQTNGVFSEEVAHWVGKNMDIVWISCDGPPEVQNFYRPMMYASEGSLSSKIVERSIKILSSYKLPTLGCRATIGAKNIHKQKEMIDYFSTFGINAVMSDPLFLPLGGFKDEKLQPEKNISLIQYVDHFVEAREYATKKGIFYGSIYSVNFDEEVDTFCRSCIPYPHLTTDGFVSCCDMACNGQDPKMQVLVYGKYDPKTDTISYNKQAIETIKSRTASNMPHCQDCDVLSHCAGACVGEALNETGSIFGVKPEACEAIKYLAKKIGFSDKLYPFTHS